MSRNISLKRLGLLGQGDGEGTERGGREDKIGERAPSAISRSDVSRG